MKIGIATVHKAPNYGANLQTYALWRYLSNEGHDCEVLDIPLNAQPPRFPLSRPEYYECPTPSLSVRIKSQLRKILVVFGIKKPIYTPPPILPAAQKKFDEFNQLINYSCRYDLLADLYANPPHYDLYVTGSDQVWNPTQHYCLEPFFLTFAPMGSRKISYAASIGIEELRENERIQFKQWLSSYEAISVREKVGCQLVKDITGREDIEQVIDPTFLLSQDEWRSFAIMPQCKNPYILVFTLGHNQELIDYALRLKSESGYAVKVVCMMALPNPGLDYESITDACPRELIGYMAQAELVLTDSFHGTVFSILMGANNFYTYLFSHAKRNSRMIDLLALMNLSNHIIDNSLADSFEVLMNRKVNHAETSNLIKLERERCRTWLLNSISQ